MRYSACQAGALTTNCHTRVVLLLSRTPEGSGYHPESDSTTSIESMQHTGGLQRHHDGDGPGLSSIPAELLAAILQHLPETARLQSKRTCKSFYRLSKQFKLVHASGKDIPLPLIHELPLPRRLEQRQQLTEARAAAGDAAGTSWLLQHAPDVVVSTMMWDAAVTSGSVDVLMALKGAYQTSQQAAATVRQNSCRLCCIAAAHGCTNVLEWLQSQIPDRCPWDQQTPIAAASSQQLTTLQWLQAQQQGCRFSASALQLEARKGNMAFMQFVRATAPACIVASKHRLLEVAAAEGHLEIAQLVYEAADGNMGVDLERYEAPALSGGHTAVVLWLRQIKADKRKQAEEKIQARRKQLAAFKRQLAGCPFAQCAAVRDLILQKQLACRQPSAAESLVKQWAAEGSIKILDDSTDEYCRFSRRVLTLVLLPEGDSIAMGSPEVTAAKFSDTANRDSFLDPLRQGSPVIKFAVRARSGIVLNLQQETPELEEASFKLFVQVLAVVSWVLQHEPDRLRMQWLSGLGEANKAVAGRPAVGKNNITGQQKPAAEAATVAAVAAGESAAGGHIPREAKKMRPDRRARSAAAAAAAEEAAKAAAAAAACTGPLPSTGS